MKRFLPLLLSILLSLTTLYGIPGLDHRAAAESVPPFTNHTLIGKLAPNGIYYGTVQVQLSASDGGSGVAITQYSLNNGATWSTYSQPLSFSDKKVYQLQYRSIDNDHNLEQAHEVIFTIKQDIIRPESSIAVTGSQGQNAYYTGPVQVSVQATDVQSDIAYSEYSLDNGSTWSRYTVPIEMTDEQINVIYYRSMDTSGNLEKTKKAKINIDATPPSIPDLIANPTEWSNSQFQVTIVDGVDNRSGTKGSQYRIGNSGNWLDYSAPFPVSGDGAITVYARTVDFAGNVSESAEQQVKFDKTAPTIPGIEISSDEWSNTDVQVTMEEGTDTESQVKGIQYRTGTSTEWLEYVDPFLITDEGLTSVYARSVDWAGNNSSEIQQVVKIDRVAPSAPTFAPSSEEWTNQDVQLQIVPGQDALSGAGESHYRLDDSEDWLLYETPLTFSDEGTVTVHAFSYDKAGNPSEDSSHIVKIDKTPPTSPTLTPTAIDWTNQNVQVTITSGTDVLSGVDRNEYRIGSSVNWMPYTGPFTMSDEGDFIVYSRTVDKAGNASEIEQTTVKIDKTAPSAPSSLFKVSQLGNTAFLRWTASTDNLSGILKYEIYDGNTLIATSTENKFRLTNLQTNTKYSITVKAIDRANNVSNANSTPLVFYTSEPMITGGRDHNFAWNQSGTVWGWGNNNRGMLGDGTTTTRYAPVSIPALQGFTNMVTGVKSNLGLRSDGTVWVWGENSAGQIVGPTKVEGLSNVVSISMGLSTYMVLKDDGTVWAWGDNPEGMIGDGTLNYRSSPVQVVGLDSVVAISNGYYHSMALKDDGTVWVWGGNGRGQLGTNDSNNHQQLVPKMVPNLTEVIQIDTEYIHSAALKKDGTLWTWGFNDNGQLGNGVEDVDSMVPVKVQNLSGVVKFSASYNHNLALTGDGSIWSWGDNYYGQLGDGTSVQRKLPVRVAHMEGITDVFAGELYSMAVKRDGSVWAWGINSYGQLGDGTTVGKNTRNLVNAIPYPTDTTAPSAPVNFRSPGKTSTTAVLAWDPSTDNHGVKEYLVYQGTTLVGTVGVDGKSIDQASEFTQNGLTSGSTYTFTVKARDYAGNISGTSNSVTVTTDVSLPMHVTSSLNHTLALKSDGSVWGWGQNNNGQLGELVGFESTVPKQSVNLTSVIAISAGHSYTLALRSDGTVWAWGTNTSGQLATTSVSYSRTPLKVDALSSIVAISAGSTFALALKDDGTVYAWGSNYYGELGQGSTGSNVYTPKKIPALAGVTSISAGFLCAFATKSDGSAWAWGMNTNGQLGDGSLTSASTPVRVANLTNVKTVSAGLYHVVALKQDGTVWAWGSNRNGELGNNTRIDSKVPVQVVNLSGIKQASAGSYFSTAMSDTTAYTWGINTGGQLGTGSIASDSIVPVAVTSLSALKQVHAGLTIGAALANNTIMTWGPNNNGQLGNGTKNNSNVPVQVTGMSGVTSGLKGSQSSPSKIELSDSEFKSVETTNPELEKLGIKIKDVFAPSIPQQVTVKNDGNYVHLQWMKSNDNVAVKEYWVYVNERKVYQTESTSTQIEMPESSVINITIRAVDSSGNVSDASVPVTP